MSHHPDKHDASTTEIDSVRERFIQLRDVLAAETPGKQHVGELLLIASLAREPLLLVGPPGTGKSNLVRHFAAACGIAVDDLFMYQLTPETSCDELRPSANSSQAGAGLESAQIVLLKQVFHGNSSVHNVLLRMLDGRRMHDRRRVFVATAYDIPDVPHVRGLTDRFVLKVESMPVHDTATAAVIYSGLRAELTSETRSTPVASATDLDSAHHWLARSLSDEVTTAAAADDPPDADAPWVDMQRIVQSLVREDRLYISDRKLTKLYKLMRAQAWLRGAERISRDELHLLAYAGDSLEEIALLREKVPVLVAKL